MTKYFDFVLNGNPYRVKTVLRRDGRRCAAVAEHSTVHTRYYYTHCEERCSILVGDDASLGGDVTCLACIAAK